MPRPWSRSPGGERQVHGFELFKINFVHLVVRSGGVEFVPHVSRLLTGSPVTRR